MQVVGIICEYNPLHRGHAKQIAHIRAQFPDCAIVSLMSGNFVQRGAPAIVDKSLRARATVECGADLVLELPVTYALSSAEGFAAGGVRILAPFCTHLCFGSETGDTDSIMRTARALLDPAFSPLLREHLARGISFPAARAQALASMGISDELLSRPNDILAVEYCKAILSQNAPLIPLPIVREGSYHALTADTENPSATAVRARMLAGEPYADLLPAPAMPIFASAPLHSINAGERAILARLRTMTDAEFEALPYGSEGLWRKLMHASRRESTLDDILSATKSKRYTRTRIDRMVMCATLGITQEMLTAPVPYTRVLAFNDRGRAVLKEAKRHAKFLNAGEASPDPYWSLEMRCGALYPLFCTDAVGKPNAETNQRIYYKGDPT